MAAAEIAMGISALYNAFKNSDENDSVKDVVKNFKGSVKNIDVVMSGGSVIKFLNNYVVQPTAVISNSLKGEEIIDKLLEIETDIFTSFYMQVFDILNKVNGMDGQIAINLLSTSGNGGVVGNVTNTTGKVLSVLDYDYTKDLLSNESILPTLSIEAGYDGLYKKNNKKEEYKHTGSKSSSDKEGDLTSNISDAIIRKFNLTMRIVNGNYSYDIEIPIVVKLNVIFAPIDSILTQLDKGENNGFMSRLDDYRSGGISLADLLFAGDLIHKYKNNELNNNDELNVLINTKKNALLSKAMGKDVLPSFERYYNFLIVSEEDAFRIAKVIKGKLNKDKYKEKVLERMYSLILTVVDRDYERVSIYIKDIAGTSDISFKALNKKKSSTDDMGELYKAMLTGRPPVL